MVCFRRSDDVSKLPISESTVSALKRSGFQTVGQMFDAPEEAIREIPQAYRILQAMALGKKDFGLLEWGMEMESKKGQLLWSLEDGYLCVWGSGKMPDYTSEVLPPWESYKEEIVEVHLEEAVSNVGARAFSACPKLKRVVLSENVVRIGYMAFADCSGLEYVDAPDSFINWRQSGPGIRVGMKAFLNTPWQKRNWEKFCIAEGVLLDYFGNDQNLVIPEGVTEIAPMVFEGHPIRRVSFPGSLRRIGQFAFRGTRIRELVIPRNVEEIESWAFGESGVESVLLYNSRVRIAPDAFAGTAVAGWEPVKGRWPGIFALAPVRIPESECMERLVVALARPIGTRTFYAGSALLQMLRQGREILQICLDENRRIEYLQFYREDWDGGFIRQKMYPYLEDDGKIGIWRDSDSYMSARGIIGCDKRGLWPPKGGRCLWYCAPGGACEKDNELSELLMNLLQRHPGYALGAPENSSGDRDGAGWDA